MKKLSILLLPFLVLFIVGCKDDNIGEVNSKLLDTNGTFTLHISNQSFKLKRVDILVKIDGELIVSEYFDVGDQHVFKDFILNLEPGKHNIYIWSQKGEAELSQDFEIQEGDNAVIQYWYSPKSETTASIKHFSFRIFQGPLMII